MNTLNYLTKDDFYEVKLGSMLASYDRDLLTTLYQPIIGYGALALFFTLWAEYKRSDFSPLNKHEYIMKVMNISSEEFLSCRKKLEGIGLVKTYKKVELKQTYYIYELFAPKSPKEFFLDPLFKGLLCQKIGSSEVKKLSIIYDSKPLELDDYQDVSAGYKEVYNNDDDASIKVLNILSSRGRKTLEIGSTFDMGEFLKELRENRGVNIEKLTPDDCNEISRIALLFGLDILSMCDAFEVSFSPFSDNCLDYDMLYKTCAKMSQGVNIKEKQITNSEYDDNDAFGKMINQMANNSPFEYLKLKQGYTNPSPADVKIINDLSVKYGFSNGVINAIVDYTLRTCNDSLPAAYVDKIGATLARKKVTTALGACNALKSRRRRKNKEPNNTVTQNQDQVTLEELLKEMEDL